LSGFPISSEVNSADDADDDIPLIQLAEINTIAQLDHETLAAFDQHVPIEDDTDELQVRRRICGQNQNYIVQF
jgi:hypothetical protein